MFRKMEDSSMDELIAEVDALSIKHHWSDSIKDAKACKNMILGIVWSEDETEDIKDCSNSSLTSQITGNFLNLSDSLNGSFQDRENFPPLFLSSEHVTVRKRLKQQVSVTDYLSECSGEEENNDTFNATRTLSFRDDNVSPQNEISNVDKDKNILELNDNLIHSGKVLECLPERVISSSGSVSGLDYQHDVTFKPDVEEKCLLQNCTIEKKELDRSSSEKCDSLTSHTPENECDKSEVIHASQIFELKENGNIVCKGESDQDAKVVTMMSGSDNDHDSVWESESDFEENECSELTLQLLNKRGCSVKSTNKKTKSSLEHSDIITNSNIACTSKTLQSKVPSVQLFDCDTSDDEFEAFLAKMRTPKPNRTPKSLPRTSLKSFIVDDWVDDSDDELLPFIGKIFSEDVQKKKKTNKTPKFTPSVQKSIVESSDEEQLPYLLNMDKKSTSHTSKMLPTNKVNTPKLKRTPLTKVTVENTLLQIASRSVIEKIVTPHINTPKKFWRKTREQLVKELFCCYNETIFDHQLSSDLPILWNKQMTKTAGFCYYSGSRENKKCRIELSDKVVDSCERIRDTLIHELCHAATWMIDGVKAGHGPHWKRWALKARVVHADLPPISRCHSYEINYKFNYKCTKCHHSFGRHSKSINVKTSRCPYCLSRLELVGRMNKDGTPAKPRAPSKFSLFIKHNYRKIKDNLPGSTHQEVMKELSKRFAQTTLNKEKENKMDNIAK